MSARGVPSNRGKSRKVGSSSADGCVDGGQIRQRMDRHILEMENYGRRVIKQDVNKCIELERSEATSKTAADSLDAIMARNFNGETISMPRVERPRIYSAWVPLNSNLDTGSYLDVDHNFPDHLDNHPGFKTAVKDYRGYLTKKGKHGKLAQFDEARTHDGSKCVPLKEIRKQEAKSKVILQVIDSIPNYTAEKHKRMVSRKFGVTEKELELIGNLKEEREAKNRRRQKYDEANLAKRGPYYGDKLPEINELAAEVSSHFCFSCHMFCCEEHDDAFHVKPAHPIRDPSVENRQKELSRKDYVPCSEYCWAADAPDYTEREWTCEELGILREMTSIFRCDPCSLALTIGTRTCDDVFRKLMEPYEAYLMKRSIEYYGRGVFEKEKKSMYKDYDDEDEDVEEENEFHDFIPCNHRGPCDDRNTCRCRRLNKYCESTCCCNNSRWCMGCEGKGIAEFIDTAHGNNSMHGKCSNLHDSSAVYGCKCDPEDCVGNNCPCVLENLSCTPGVCACTKSHGICNPVVSGICICKPESCRAVYCTNIPAGAMKRKKTLLGHSPVHGYGLFAGEFIAKGQFIGAYTGQLVNTNVAELLGFTYDEQNHTFLFDLTNNTVSDGTILGSKMKFINHGRGAKQGENCHSKKQFHRGNIHLGMFANCDIQPGDELRFDYQFQNAIPDWMGGNKVASDSNKAKRRASKTTSQR